jgi:molybdopterin-synthase adenylyltransferase
MLRIDAVGGRTEPVTLDRDPGCPHHHPLAGTPQLVSATSHSPLSELVSELAPADEPFTWGQFSLGRRCGGCGQTDGSPAQAGPVCGRCGGLIRDRLSQRLRDAAPEARLSDLGIAPEDILPVLTTGGEYRCLRLSR